MSGDVQARKRKEKRRKKDEEDSGIPAPTLGNSNESLTDNITIHIYKENSTGGHWCARIIFFAILAVLIGLIGIIILEHRGTTDINTPLESSRWAFIFDGWVDDSLSLSNEELHNENGYEDSKETERDEATDDHDTEIESTVTENSNEEEEQIDEENEEEEQIGEDSEDTQVDEEEEEEEEEVEEKEEVEEEQEEQEEVEKEEEDEEEDTNKYEELEEETTEVESDEEQSRVFQDKEEYVSTELNHQKEYEEKLMKIIREDENISPQNSYDTDVLEEIYATSKEESKENVLYETDSQFHEIEKTSTNEDIFESFLDIPDINEINDDNIEPLEEVESIEPEEYISDIDKKPDIEEIEEESISVAMKFGVGVALVVAAHFVLVKRWNNEVTFIETESNIISSEKRSREQTTTTEKKRISEAGKYRKEDKEKIVVKKGPEEEIEDDSKEWKWKREEIDIKLEEEEEIKPKIKKEKEVLERESEEAEDEEEVEDEEELVEDEEDEEEEVEEEEEEGEEEDEEDDYDDDEIDNFDDSELVAKLEAKYGKLQNNRNETKEAKETETNTVSKWKPSRNIVAEFAATVKVNDKTKTENIMANKSGTRVYDFNISNVESNLKQKENNYDTYKEHIN